MFSGVMIVDCCSLEVMAAESHAWNSMTISALHPTVNTSMSTSSLTAHFGFSCCMPRSFIPGAVEHIVTTDPCRPYISHRECCTCRCSIYVEPIMAGSRDCAQLCCEKAHGYPHLVSPLIIVGVRDQEQNSVQPGGIVMRIMAVCHVGCKGCDR